MAKGRKKKYSPDEPCALVLAMEHANLLYHQNDMKMSAVARNMGSSVSVIEPLVFPNRASWERWEDAGKPALLPRQFLASESPA